MMNDTISSDRFSWADRHGFTFASDLGVAPGELPYYFSVRSARTGTTRTFHFLRNEYDLEGEVVGVRYISGDVELTIGND
jgi:hypothetical protein